MKEFLTTVKNLISQIPTIISENENIFGVASHLGALFGGFVVPLIIFLLSKDHSSYVADHAKEALNFQISLCIYGVIALILFLTIV
jgi:uncharacterized Tic20 family protein